MLMDFAIHRQTNYTICIQFYIICVYTSYIYIYSNNNNNNDNNHDNNNNNNDNSNNNMQHDQHAGMYSTCICMHDIHIDNHLQQPWKPPVSAVPAAGGKILDSKMPVSELTTQVPSSMARWLL